MTSSLHSSVLIIGATSGIGQGLAERTHALGKKVIACGRRQDRLDALAQKHQGMLTHPFDIAKIDTLEEQVDQVFKKYPDIATVIVAAGIQTYGSFHDIDHFPSAMHTLAEMNTNIVGPMILSQFIIPKLLTDRNRLASLIFIGSGLGFVPSPRLASYCATKAALHSLAVSLRADLVNTNVKVVEIIPPYTRTDLGHDHEKKMMADFGDLAKFIVPLELNDLLDITMKGLQEGKAEVMAGTATDRGQAWRKAFQPFLDKTGSKG